MEKIRTFNTGATRDTDKGKLDFEGFLSPLVLERYAQYMDKTRLQSDGNYRDSDNWQKGFGEDHFGVCMKSAWRHFIDLWKEHRKIPSKDGIDAAICGVLFNIMAYYHQILKDRSNEKMSKMQD